MSAAEVVARRRAGRRERLATATRYAEAVRERIPVRAAVVFGSVARGDWHGGSDIDVLIVAEVPPALRMLDRLEAAGTADGGVQPLVWTPAEWSGRLARADRYARACVEEGVWLLGSPAALEPGGVRIGDDTGSRDGHAGVATDSKSKSTFACSEDEEFLGREER